MPAEMPAEMRPRSVADFAREQSLATRPAATRAATRPRRAPGVPAGSGKTFTMEGPGGDPGVTPRAVERLFAHAAELSALGSSFEFEV